MTVGENRLIICVISANSVIFHKVKLILAANRINSITDSGADCLGNVTKNLILKLNESFLSFCGLIRTVHGYVTTVPRVNTGYCVGKTSSQRKGKLDSAIDY